MCSTCTYTEVEVWIGYRTIDGSQETYKYKGSMVALIRELTDDRKEEDQ